MAVWCNCCTDMAGFGVCVTTCLCAVCACVVHGALVAMAAEDGVAPLPLYFADSSRHFVAGSVRDEVGVAVPCVVVVDGVVGVRHDGQDYVRVYSDIVAVLLSVHAESTLPIRSKCGSRRSRESSGVHCIVSSTRFSDEGSLDSTRQIVLSVAARLPPSLTVVSYRASVHRSSGQHVRTRFAVSVAE